MAKIIIQHTAAMHKLWQDISYISDVSHAYGRPIPDRKKHFKLLPPNDTLLLTLLAATEGPAALEPVLAQITTDMQAWKDRIAAGPVTKAQKTATTNDLLAELKGLKL